METKPLPSPALYEFEQIKIYVDGKMQLITPSGTHYQDWFAERTEGHNYANGYPWALLYEYASEVFEDESYNGVCFVLMTGYYKEQDVWVVLRESEAV